MRDQSHRPPAGDPIEARAKLCMNWSNTGLVGTMALEGFELDYDT
jgi:hypothetical protein